MCRVFGLVSFGGAQINIDITVDVTAQWFALPQHSCVRHQLKFIAFTFGFENTGSVCGMWFFLSRFRWTIHPLIYAPIIDCMQKQNKGQNIYFPIAFYIFPSSSSSFSSSNVRWNAFIIISLMFVIDNASAHAGCLRWVFFLSIFSALHFHFADWFMYVDCIRNEFGGT